MISKTPETPIEVVEEGETNHKVQSSKFQVNKVPSSNFKVNKVPISKFKVN